MDSILVEVYAPAAGITYDVYIPLSAKLSELIALLDNALSGLPGSGVVITNNAVLCDKLSGKILDKNISPRELGLHNGSQLILI